MKVSAHHQVATIAENTDDAANDLLALYIHDDRLGPYLRADLASKDVQRWNSWTRRWEPKSRLHVIIPERALSGSSDGKQSWELTHVLLPMHVKIRLSFGGLRHVAREVAKVALGFRETYAIPPEAVPDPTVTIDTWIVRAHKYVENLFLASSHAAVGLVNRVCTTISLARYVGVVRMTASYFDPIDVIVDTTSTMRNIHCLGVVVPTSSMDLTPYMARHFGVVFNDCPVVL